MFRLLHDRVWSELPSYDDVRRRVLTALSFILASLVIGMLLALRRHGEESALGLAPFTVPAVGLAIGLLMTLPGIGPPLTLKIMQVLSTFGFVVVNLLMVAMFAVIITPLGWIMRLIGRDPLEIRRHAAPRWHPHRLRRGRRHYQRLF